MIPSRALALPEIISETFSIYAKIFLRYGLLFLLFIVPGTILLTVSAQTISIHIISAARHDIAFNDSDLTAIRNDFNAAITAQNPAITETLPGAKEAYPHPSTTRFISYVKSNSSRFSSDVGFLALGVVLIVIGLFALAAVSVDLASQSFEERPLEPFGSLRQTFARHLWFLILLYIAYFCFVWSVNAILYFVPGAAGQALGALALFFQIFIVVRLSVTVPALVCEALGPIPALARSWQLTRGVSWRIAGISFVMTAILCVGLIILTIVLGMVFSGAMTWWSDFLTRDRLTIAWLLATIPGFISDAAIISTIVSLLLLGIIAVFGTVLYYDLRTRHDGPLVYLEE